MKMNLEQNLVQLISAANYKRPSFSRGSLGKVFIHACHRGNDDLMGSETQSDEFHSHT